MTLARVKTWIAGEVLTASDLNTEFDHCNNNLAVSSELAASAGSSLIGFIAAGTGAVARTSESKNRDFVTSFDYMTPAQIADVQARTTTLDVTSAVQAAFNASTTVHLLDGLYKLTSSLTATIHHTILGDGFSKSVLAPTHTNFAITIAAPVSDTIATLNLDQFSITSKNGVSVGGTRASQPTDGAIIGGRINVRVVGTYTGSGDTAYNTDKVRDSGSSLVSSNTGTSLSARKTYDDISAFGIGLQLSKCIDTLIEYPQFYGNGVSVSLLGSDLIKWRGGRSQEVGLFFYSERIGTWGSQAELRGVDLLHNRRAGGLLLNGTKFDRADDCYYECYSDSALLLFADGTEGVLMDDNRIDDPYYTGGGGTAAATTPIMLFSAPYYNNKIRATRFQKFSAFSTAIPPVRVIGSLSACDTNHPELIAIEPASGYVPIRYKDIQFGCRFGYLNPFIYTPNNVPLGMGGSMTPLAVADGSKNVFYNASALTITARIDVPQIKTAYTLRVDAKAASGTTIFFTVEHHSYDGTLLETLFTSTIGSFSASVYSAQTQALTLTALPNEGDYILVVWTASSAYIAGVALE